MTIGFDEVKNDMARMDIRWEKTRVSVAIEAPATDQAMANIKEALTKPGREVQRLQWCGQLLPEPWPGARGSLGMGAEVGVHGTEVLEHAHARARPSRQRHDEGGHRHRSSRACALAEKDSNTRLS